MPTNYFYGIMEICMDIQILNRQHRTLMHRYEKAKYTKFYPDPLRIHIYIYIYRKITTVGWER